MWGFFALGAAAMAAMIAQLLRRYAAPSVPGVVRAATAYAWGVSMSIVLITPLDVAATLLAQPEPGVGVLWKITYWSTQARELTAATAMMAPITAAAAAAAATAYPPASLATPRHPRPSAHPMLHLSCCCAPPLRTAACLLAHAGIDMAGAAILSGVRRRW